MNDADVFNSIIEQLRKESPEMPKGTPIRYRTSLGLYGALWVMSFVCIIVSLVVNYPLMGLLFFIVLVACSNIILSKVQPRLHRK